MFSNLLKKFQNNSFLKESSWIFAVSITVAIFNYLLIIAANRTLKTEYELWNTISSLMAIMAAPMAGFSLEIMKKTAKLSKINPQSAFAYYYFLRRKVGFLVLFGLILSPFLAFPLQIWLLHPKEFATLFTNFSPIFSQHFGMETLTIFLTLWQTILGFLFVSNQFFFLGKMDLKKYTFVVGGGIILRFLLTILMIGFGFKIFDFVFNYEPIFKFKVLALPLAAIISSGLFYILSEQKVRRESNKLVFPDLHFSLKEEISLIIKSVIIGFFLTTYLDLSSLLSRNFFEPLSFDANLYATINIFAKVAYFGINSFLGGLVVYAVSDNNQKIYKASILSIIAATVGIGVFLRVLAPVILTSVLGRSEFLPFVDLIFAAVAYTGFYTIIFASVQYLLARSQYKVAFFVVFLTTFLYGFLTFGPNLQIFGLPSVPKVYFINIFVSIIGAIYYVIAILFGTKISAFYSQITKKTNSQKLQQTDIIQS